MEPTYIETTGETVEDAISKGLAELGVSPSQVMIEVLDEPSTGIFGIGARPARVRLQLLGGRPQMPPPPASSTAIYTEPDARQISSTRDAEARPSSEHSPDREKPPRRERDHNRERGGSGERRERPARTERRERDEKKPLLDLDNLGVDAEDQELPVLYEADEVPDNEQDEEAQVAKVVLNELLERMQIRARIAVRRATPGEEGGKSPWVLDVGGGRSLNRLIGRRGETLAALQYITRLVASRELQRRVDVVVDVESYKVKRAGTLHNLALRMADEAVKQNRTITLEPMPPHERRIIHLALRERADVVTKSVGEGASRKVTIVPQQSAE
jgi:spoIIIJ-associated protein